MIFLFLNSHPTFIREVVSVGKKVSEASLQIVPKYLSQTWRARSNYCCQPPFKVLLTQVANHPLKVLLTHLCTKVTQRQGFFHQTRITEISMILLTLSFMTFADFWKISRNLLACLLRAFFSLSFFWVLLSDSASWVAWRLSERVWAGQIWWGLDHC